MNGILLLLTKNLFLRNPKPPKISNQLTEGARVKGIRYGKSDCQTFNDPGDLSDGLMLLDHNTERFEFYGTSYEF